MPIRKSYQPQKAKTNECIVVAGINTINQISTKSNNINHYDAGIVSPPISTSFKKDDHLSYSVYFSHSVVVKKDSAFSIGVNTGNKKTQEKPKLLSTLSEIELEFEEKNNYSIASAVCGSCYTLYLLNPLDSEENPLLACYWESQKEPSPVFIFLNDLIPIALFGGRKIAAAIDDKGDIIAITGAVILSEDHKGEIISLPNNEKATFVSCLEKTLIILSNEGKVYEYNIGNTGEKEVEEIEELKEIRIKTLSGTWRHCLAVTEDGEVYGRGFNEYGQLCQSEEKKRIDKFEKIKELEQEHIESAYAGSYHSLFINTKGEVISSGRNENGELLLSEGSSEEIKNTPCCTSIKEGARYCIAGCQLSCVFINCDPPKNSPNQKIEIFNINQKAEQKKQLSQSQNKKTSGNKQIDTNQSKEFNNLFNKLNLFQKELQSFNNKITDLKKGSQLLMNSLDQVSISVDQLIGDEKISISNLMLPSNNNTNNNKKKQQLQNIKNEKQSIKSKQRSNSKNFNDQTNHKNSVTIIKNPETQVNRINQNKKDNIRKPVIRNNDYSSSDDEIIFPEKRPRNQLVRRNANQTVKNSDNHSINVTVSHKNDYEKDANKIIISPNKPEKVLIVSKKKNAFFLNKDDS